MKTNWLITILMAALMLLWFVGCEGPEGPAGAQGEQGPQGESEAQYTYLGNDEETCGHCHGDVVETWAETGHYGAWDALGEENQSNLYCVQCHTVGFDAEVSYGDTVVVTPGPDLNGFDDYYPPVTAEDEMRVSMLKNVQCESCHGSMGPTIYDHAPILNYDFGTIDSSDPSMCAKCHGQVDEWQESGHGEVLETHQMNLEEFTDEWQSNSCWTCHTAEGYVANNDPYWAAEAKPELLHLISCQACHDPHDDTNEHQLRNLDDYTVLYDQNDAATFTGYGPAQTCVQCHHARRSTENVNNQIAEGYAHFGPHGSPQMDMFVGSGSYEIEGYTYEREHDHQMATTLNSEEPNEACVTCHMEFRDHSDPEGWKGGHDFTPTPETCATACHSVPDDFDYHGEPTELDGLAQDLIDLIGIDPEELGDPEVSTEVQRMAGYAYVFYMNDGSHGIHNPTYARSLLENAIDFMSPPNAKNGLIANK